GRVDAGEEMCHLPGHPRILLVSLSRRVLPDRIGLFLQDAIQVEAPLPHLDGVARETDEPLHPLHRIFKRGIENQDVSPMRFRISWCPDHGAGETCAEGETVHNEEVSNEE